MLFYNEFLLAKQRQEEIAQAVARESALRVDVHVNVLANALNLLKAAFGSRKQTEQTAARRKLAAE